MSALAAGLGAVATGGVLAVAVAPLFGRSAARERVAVVLAVLGVLAGAALILPVAWGVLAGRGTLALHVPMHVPGGSFSLVIDRLAAFFLVAIVGVGGLGAVYGAGYLERHRGHKALGPHLLFFNLLLVSMCVVVLAGNAVLFLIAWQLMTTFAYLLVSFDDEHEDVRRAAMTYVVISHLGTVVLIAFFLLLGQASGSLDFDAIRRGPLPTPEVAATLAVLALVGFATKAGIWPLHTWLPLAHPAAPTHVSAVMSGVIVKVSLYALIRGLSLVGVPSLTFGLIVVLAGAASALLGVLYALAQHDLKRLLAYHTIENVGIIVLGIGVGLLGLSQGNEAVAVLGFAGGVLHVLNHALFKGLLFFGAGAVLQATRTRDMERLGGLARAMPWTAGTFLLASCAICGLPPLNGFVSEWLVYAGSLGALRELPLAGALGGALTLVALAAIGGLAAACFAKAFGVVFLGSPRTPAGRDVRECGRPMRVAMLVAAAACAAIGLLPHLAGRVVLPLAQEVAAAFRRAPAPLDPPATLPAGDALASIASLAATLLGIIVGLALVRRWCVGARPPADLPTWGCGYGDATARMQYTASSFADPLLRLARAVLRPHITDHPPEGYFPERSTRATHTGDLVDDRLYRPLVRLGAAALLALRPIQHGRLHLYLLYPFLTVVALLVWQLVTHAAP